MSKKRVLLIIVLGGALLIGGGILFVSLATGDRGRTVDEQALETIIARMEEEHRELLGPSGLEEYGAFFEFDSEGYQYFSPAEMSPFPGDDHHIEKLENFEAKMEDLYARLEKLVDEYYFYHQWEHFLEPAGPNYLTIQQFFNDARRYMMRLAAEGHTTKAADIMILQLRFFERCLYYPVLFSLSESWAIQLIDTLPFMMRYPGIEKEFNRMEEALENLARSLHDSKRVAAAHREAFYYVASTPEMLNAPRGNYFSLFGEDGTIGFYSSLMFWLIQYQRREPQWLEDTESRQWLEKQSEKLKELEDSVNVKEMYPPLLNPLFFANFRSRIREMVEKEPFFQQDFPGLPLSYHEALPPELRIHVLISPQIGAFPDYEVPLKAKIDMGRMFLKTSRFLSEEGDFPPSIDKLLEKYPLQSPLLLPREDYHIRNFHGEDREKGVPLLKQWITSRLTPHMIQSAVAEKNDLQMFFTIRGIQQWHIGRSWQGFLQELEPIVRGTGEEDQWISPEEDEEAAFAGWLSQKGWEDPFPAKVHFTVADDFEWGVIYLQNNFEERCLYKNHPVVDSPLVIPFGLPEK